MSVFVFLLVSALLIVWIIRRRARATELSGRDSTRPTFHIEPPSRRLGKLKDSAL